MDRAQEDKVRFAAARKRTIRQSRRARTVRFCQASVGAGTCSVPIRSDGHRGCDSSGRAIAANYGRRRRVTPASLRGRRDYLDAVQMDFQENSCLAYLQTVEKTGIFEMGEIWLLSSMLQLHILAEVSRIVQKPNAELPADSGERIEKLAATLVRVQKASWKATFQSLSVTEAILCEDPVGAYAKMDFRNCGSYRDAVEELSKYSGKTEDEVARIAVNMARAGLARFPAGSRLAQRHGHVGYYLVDKGRVYLEKEIGYRPQGMAFVRAVLLEAPALFYFLGVEFCIFAILLFILSGISVGVPFVAATLLFLLPVSEAAIEVINPFILFLLPPRVLPRMDFSRGIPEECTTVVAVPTLLISKDQVQDLVRSLEIRYLGNVDPNLYFALLTDPPDSAQAFDEKDELVAFCSNLIEQLNVKYGQNGSGCFFLLHRNRTFNETEQTWMGWERKRGKLLDFNELLRGGQDSFPVKVGDVSRLEKNPIRHHSRFGHAVAARFREAPGWRYGSPVESGVDRSALQHGSRGLWSFATARWYQRKFGEPFASGLHLFGPDRTGYLHQRGLRCVPGSFRRRNIYWQRHLRSGRVPASAGETLSFECDLEPRLDRRRLFPDGPAHRSGDYRRLSVAFQRT